MNKVMQTQCFFKRSDHKDFILTARPEKFVEKYLYYMEQMEKNKKSFAEINYDDEVEKDEVNESLSEFDNSGTSNYFHFHVSVNNARTVTKKIVNLDVVYMRRLRRDF
ncbi:unnamed protein product [Rhizophagus irregularis]|nr:unnamed protein product [Rhizophagus irregularis]CAB5156057.1 unnamed protein product [Rhizophagus irregularis]